MLVLQSRLLSKARKEAPADADTISHKLLARAGYIDQLGSGIFSMLPLGLRVQQQIENIIREEMKKLGAQELLLPALQPARLWQESGRLTTMDPPLFQTTDRHGKELVLASTHEEVITDLARKFINSYKDLPLPVFQIQTKFRNEMRPTGGLLRVREFQMKDLYSFHSSNEDLAKFYELVRQAYELIFKRCKLDALSVEASSGTIGGSLSHEFSVEAASGEDKVAVCASCQFAANLETLTGPEQPCPKCQGNFVVKSCIEAGHTFQLGVKYSEKMGAYFVDENGQRNLLQMGCYGIGVGRLLAAIVEVHHDDQGLIWPAAVSPFQLQMVALQPSVLSVAQSLAEKVAHNFDVLLDDRAVSAGQKLAEMDLLGVTYRVVVSEKTQKKGIVEWSERSSGKKATEEISPDKLAASLEKNYAAI